MDLQMTEGWVGGGGRTKPVDLYIYSFDLATRSVNQASAFINLANIQAFKWYYFLCLCILAVWRAGPAVPLIPFPAFLLFLGCVIRCVLVAAGERQALWNLNNGELVPSFPFAACFRRVTECQWDIRVETGWIRSGPWQTGSEWL